MYKLSLRMQLIYDHLLPEHPVWDFCCDHGYMGLNAYASECFSEVHFVDQVPSIISRLQSRFHKEYYQPHHPTQAYFYAQKGEEILSPICGTLVIAGVGALNIYKILCELHQRGVLQTQRMILGPQRDEKKLHDLLREKLFSTKQWKLYEHQVMERGRVRKLLILDKN
ncbi:MAG: SAM-dependent methyltransferase [Bdellovibrio sp.]